MLWPLFLVLLLGWLVVLRWQGRRIREVAKQMKNNFTQLPLIGILHKFIGDGEVRMNVFKSLAYQALNGNGWTSIQLGPHFFGLVADAKDAEYILKTHLEKDDILKISRILIGNGLIFAPVSIWRPRRKIMAPCFNQYNLNKFVDVFYQQSRKLVDALSKEEGCGPFSMWSYLTSYSMEAVSQTTLGINIGAQETPDHEFPKKFQQFSDLSAKRIFRPWIHNHIYLKYFCYFGMYQRIMECVRYLHAFVIDLIEKKRKSLKEKREDQPFKAILELLIELSGGEMKGYSNYEILEETQVVLFAGTDTSAVGIGFVAMMLARHPDLQEKVYREINEFYGDSERPIKADDLCHLHYLEAFVKETLRLYPPVPITARKLLKDDVTPSGIKLIAGMRIVIFHWAVQRDPKHWGADAELFRPERFFDSPPTLPSAFMPFSTGPRNCLGYKYAMMSMMTVITTLLRRYRFMAPATEELNKPIRLSYEIMMKPVNKFQLQIEPRR